MLVRKRTASSAFGYTPRARAYGSRVKRARLTRSVSSRGGVELKFVDTLFAANIQNTGSVNLVNGVIQGDSIGNRSGSKTFGHSLCIRYFINMAAFPAGNSAADMLRMFVVYDKQPNGALPAIAQIMSGYDNTTTITAAADLALVGRNPINRERFVILKDKQIYLPAVTMPGAAATSACFFPPQQATGVINIKLSKLNTVFNIGNAGTVADMQTGSLLLCYAGLQGTNPVWTVLTNTRYVFRD